MTIEILLEAVKMAAMATGMLSAAYVWVAWPFWLSCKLEFTKWETPLFCLGWINFIFVSFTIMALFSEAQS